MHALYMQLGQEIAVARGRISETAALRSGMSYAEKHLNEVLALENASKRAGIMRSTDVSSQAILARDILAKSIDIKRQMEQGMLSTDMELVRLESYKKQLEREMARGQ